MSYDLMVFEPDAAPRDRDAYMAWYHQVTQWKEGHSYDDPAISSPNLQVWYRDMIPSFPAMSGPDRISEGDPRFDTDCLTDYSCASNAIYVCFAWSLAGAAYERTLKLAAKHRVGFFDVSATDGAVWLPKNGRYGIVHGGGPNTHGPINKIFEWFKSVGRE